MRQFYVNRTETCGLRDLHQQLARELEQREERDHQHRDAALRIEQLAELRPRAAPSARAGSRSCGRAPKAPRATRGGARVSRARCRRLRQASARSRGVDVGQALRDRSSRSRPKSRSRRGPTCGSSSSPCAAFFMRSYSSRRRTSSARGSSSIGVGARRPRQQQARLDLHQHRRHHQVLGGELEVGRAHRLDVLQVLARERRHRDVEDVEVFLADQVQKQVEGALEGLEHDLQRIRRDVEVVRQLDDRLAVDLGGRRSWVGEPHALRARRAWFLRRACAPCRSRRQRCSWPAPGRRHRSARARGSAPARD